MTTKTNYCINTLAESKSQDSFDVEKYKQRTTNFQLGEYSDTLLDGTIIRRIFFLSNEIFVEREKPPMPNLFHVFRSFYPNGKLKDKGLYYPDDFAKGVWREYDEQGNLINEENHDKDYNFSFEEVLKVVERKHLNITNVRSHIGRENCIWYITSIDDSKYPYKKRSIKLDGKTGKKLSDKTTDLFIEE